MGHEIGAVEKGGGDVALERAVHMVAGDFVVVVAGDKYFVDAEDDTDGKVQAAGVDKGVDEGAAAGEGLDGIVVAAGDEDCAGGEEAEAEGLIEVCAYKCGASCEV